MTYIIHGKNKDDCRRIVKHNNLKPEQCVFVLAEFTKDCNKDTPTIKHIWGETK